MLCVGKHLLRLLSDSREGETKEMCDLERRRRGSDLIIVPEHEINKCC